MLFLSFHFWRKLMAWNVCAHFVPLLIDQSLCAEIPFSKCYKHHKIRSHYRMWVILK